MANHYYIISEEKFYRDKESDLTVFEFVKDTEIDLSLQSLSKIPKIAEIRSSIKSYGLSIIEETTNNDRFEIVCQNDNENTLHFIFTDYVTMADESFMFNIERGSDPYLTINFIKFLGLTFGRFLYYCDSGAMSLIYPDKSTEQIYNEIFE